MDPPRRERQGFGNLTEGAPPPQAWGNLKGVNPNEYVVRVTKKRKGKSIFKDEYGNSVFTQQQLQTIAAAQKGEKSQVKWALYFQTPAARKRAYYDAIACGSDVVRDVGIMTRGAPGRPSFRSIPKKDLATLYRMPTSFGQTSAADFLLADPSSGSNWVNQRKLERAERARQSRAARTAFIRQQMSQGFQGYQPPQPQGAYGQAPGYQAPYYGQEPYNPEEPTL